MRLKNRLQRFFASLLRKKHARCHSGGSSPATTHATRKSEPANAHQAATSARSSSVKQPSTLTQRRARHAGRAVPQRIQLARRQDDQVKPDAQTVQRQLQGTTAPAAMGGLRHDNNQIHIAVGLRVAAGVGAKQQHVLHVRRGSPDPLGNLFAQVCVENHGTPGDCSHMKPSIPVGPCKLG